MRTLFLLAMGGAIGAALSYLFDEQRGEQRRAAMRERLMDAGMQMQEQAEMASREMMPRVEQARRMRDEFVAEAAQRAERVARSTGS